LAGPRGRTGTGACSATSWTGSGLASARKSSRRRAPGASSSRPRRAREARCCGSATWVSSPRREARPPGVRRRKRWMPASCLLDWSCIPRRTPGPGPARHWRQSRWGARAAPAGERGWPLPDPTGALRFHGRGRRCSALFCLSEERALGTSPGDRNCSRGGRTAVYCSAADRSVGDLSVHYQVRPGPDSQPPLRALMSARRHIRARSVGCLSVRAGT